MTFTCACCYFPQGSATKNARHAKTACVSLPSKPFSLPHSQSVSLPPFLLIHSVFFLSFISFSATDSFVLHKHKICDKSLKLSSKSMAILGGFPSGYPFGHAVYFQTLMQITTQPPLNQKSHPTTFAGCVHTHTLLMQHKHKQFKALKQVTEERLYGLGSNKKESELFLASLGLSISRRHMQTAVRNCFDAV